MTMDPDMKPSDAHIEVVRLEIANLQLEPGDTLLVRVPRNLLSSSTHRNYYQETLRQALPDDVHFLIHDDLFEFSVISATPTEEIEP
jgi:hypothetical protein